MKKIMALVFAMVFALCPGAFAEGPEMPDLAEYKVLPGEKITLDLDGDGSEEIFSCDIAYDDDAYTETAMVNVIGDGTGAEHFVDLYMAEFYVLDVDADGVYEIFISGDMMSYDFMTVCLHYDGGKLIPVLFEAVAYGEEDELLRDYGWGMLMEVADGKLTLNGTHDILGTYFGSRIYALKDGMFVFADDGLCVFDCDLEDGDIWEYSGLTPVMDIPATFIDAEGNAAEGVIAAGEKFIITSSDKVSVVNFIMQDGRTGSFAVEPDAEAGYGVKVNGVSEWDLFEHLPYAG